MNFTETCHKCAGNGLRHERMLNTGIDKNGRNVNWRSIRCEPCNGRGYVLSRIGIAKFFFAIAIGAIVAGLFL